MLSLFMLFAGYAFATPGIHEALKNPSAITVLKFTGEKNEAALFVKNAFRFTALNQIQLSGITDSVLAEHSIAAIAACPSVTKVSFDKCGFAHLSYAVKMLVSVKEVEISNCPKLDIDGTFSCLAGMPSLKSISYSTSKLARMPQSFKRMRSLSKISISNTDLSLADGYALNTTSPRSLFTSEKLELGFGTASLVLEYSCYDKKTAKEHVSIMRDMLQGATGMNGEIILPQRAASFTRENPLVQPPISGLDIQKSIYSTNATSGGLVEYPSGTKIIIPARAFVDANGNEIKGNVTIDYREFRDPVDILVSGIPMVYDSAGQSGDFESAGMFEINASVAGKEVFLAPGKKVDVQFAVVDTASTFNFYRLDPVKGWVYESKPGATEEKQEVMLPQNPFRLSYAVQRYRMKTMEMLRKRPSLGDTVSFDARYEDTNYVYMTKTIRTNFDMKSTKRQMQMASKWRFRKMPAGKGNTCFMLNRVNYVRAHENNPEMQYFSGVMWQAIDPVSRNEFRKYFGTRSGLNDIRIEYEGGSTFTMELKYLWGFKRIAVTPVKLVDKKPVAYSEKNCARLFKNYSKSLERRKTRLERTTRRKLWRLRAWTKAASQDSVANWKKLKGVMTTNEKPLEYKEWISYSRNQVFKLDSINGTGRQSQQGAVYQALSLQGFGIYNCDQIRRITNPVEVYAMSLDSAGKPRANTSFYVIDKGRNMVFSYYGRITYGEHENNVLLAVGPDGSLAYTDEVDFTRKQKMSKGYGFPSREVATKPVSAQELRDILFPAEGTQ
jgi:hypothetical protein